MRDISHVREIGGRAWAGDGCSPNIANLLVMDFCLVKCYYLFCSPWARDKEKPWSGRDLTRPALLLSFNHNFCQARTFGDERLSTAI